MREMSTIWAIECDVAPIVSGTLKNCFELILNHFMEHWTNVYTEGVNYKIKLIKRRTFGFTNFDHSRPGNLVKFAPNPT